MTWNPPRDPNYGRPPAHPRIPVLAIFLTLVLTRPELSPPVTRRVLENQSLRDEMARHSAEDYAATAYLRAQLKDAVAGVKRMEKEAVEKDVAFEERLASHEKAAASRAGAVHAITGTPLHHAHAMQRRARARGYP